MKRSLFKTFLVILLAVFLAACNSGNGADSQNISVEEEFKQYRKAVIEPLEERSVEYAEMFNHYASIIEETEEAHRYLEEEVVPFAEESKKIASDAHDGLVNEEIRELNDTTVEYLDLTLDSLQKSMDLLAIELSPVTEETYQKAVKIHEENMELQEKIEQTGAEMDRQIDDLANEQ
jgi:predicted small secreted protein/methylthioribose-1-phosphate isomerase